MIGSDMRIEEQFFTWLSLKVNLSKISGLYSAYTQIEEFCLNRNILKKPLFQTTDIETITKVKTTIEANRVFKFQYRNKCMTTSAINYYYKYIKENQELFNPIKMEQIEKEKMNNHFVKIVETPIKKEVDKGKIEDNSISQAPKPYIVPTTEVGGILTVNFNNTVSYAYTRPIKLSYFGQIHNNCNNWTQMYVTLVKCLLGDYDWIICDLNGKSITGNGNNRVDFGDKSYKNNMAAPKYVDLGLYVETNYSASDINNRIKQLLDLCKVDYKNVVIYYINAREQNRTNQVDNTSKNSYKVELRNNYVDKGKAFYNLLSEEEGYVDAICRSYVSAINGEEKFTNNHNIATGRIYSAKDNQEAKEIIDALFKDRVFIINNEQQHNRFKAASPKYVQFLSEGRKTFKAAKSNSENVELKLYKDLLSEKYQKGFRLESRIEMKRFRHYWEEKYGKELKADDDSVRKNISRITIKHNDFAYLSETMLPSNSKERLLAYITRCFSEEKEAIYYNALFEELSEVLELGYINNPEMLKVYLDYIDEGRYYLGRSYIAINSRVKIDPIDEVRNYLISKGTPITTDKIREDLSNIPRRNISNILSMNAEFRRNAVGEYFHPDAVDIDCAELNDISILIQQVIEDNYFITGNELISAIKTKYPQILERQTQFSELGMREAIGYKLKDRFSFNGNIISELGKDLLMYDVYANYCKKHNKITLTDLNNLKKALDTKIYFEAVYDNSLRISQDEFVSKEQVAFDLEETDEAIDRFCTEKYIAIRDISYFGSFPYAGFAWNSYLLEHYVAKYSKNYKLLHINYNANSCVGAIVKRTSGIEDFDSLITDVLAQSDIALNPDAALQYLCDRGFIARRTFKNIDQILVNAKVLRAKKG